VLFKAALKQASGRARIGTLLADADLDGEKAHQHVRTDGILALIPPERDRPSDKPPAGKWRRRMKQWPGSAPRARNYPNKLNIFIKNLIIYKTIIVAIIGIFYGA
jgi:hypothetical protein